MSPEKIKEVASLRNLMGGSPRYTCPTVLTAPGAVRCCWRNKSKRKERRYLILAQIKWRCVILMLCEAVGVVKREFTCRHMQIADSPAWCAWRAAELISSHISSYVSRPTRPLGAYNNVSHARII